MIDDHEAVAAALRGAASSLSSFIDGLVERMRRGGRLLYVGAGTSGRLGVLDAAECPPTFHSDPNQVVAFIAGGDASLRRSSEAREDDPNGAAADLAALKLTERDTVLGIAAGGTTPYVLGALQLSSTAGAITALLACAPPPSAPPACDHLIVLDTGPELLTGSTRLKAGSATKLALNIITTTAFVRLGKVYSNLMVDLRATNAKLTDRAIRILMTVCPDLTRNAAAVLLDRAERQVKPAIVMHRLNLDLKEARHVLDQCQGSLRSALEMTGSRT